MAKFDGVLYHGHIDRVAHRVAHKLGNQPPVYWHGFRANCGPELIPRMASDVALLWILLWLRNAKAMANTTNRVADMITSVRQTPIIFTCAVFLMMACIKYIRQNAATTFNPQFAFIEKSQVLLKFHGP